MFFLKKVDTVQLHAFIYLNGRYEIFPNSKCLYILSGDSLRYIICFKKERGKHSYGSFKEFIIKLCSIFTH